MSFKESAWRAAFECMEGSLENGIDKGVRKAVILHREIQAQVSRPPRGRTPTRQNKPNSSLSGNPL